MPASAAAPKEGSQSLSAPHRSIEAADARERFALDLFDDLWKRYRSRVSHVRTYERIVRESQAAFVNDHVAFRTFGCQDPPIGIHSISRIFEALGYVPAACYSFPDKHLRSIHFQHPNARFPKLFISELKTWELTADSRKRISATLASHRKPFPDSSLADIRTVASLPAWRRRALLKTLRRFFAELPWDVPRKDDVLALDRENQFAAWVLVHGCDVNHFTASVNSHRVCSLDDIDKTVAALRRAGVPMKSDIEGARGSKLRQSATEAVVIAVKARQGSRVVRLPWTYAYFEIAERGETVDPETGRRVRFEGFLGGQAAQLFEMTRVKGVGAPVSPTPRRM